MPKVRKVPRPSGGEDMVMEDYLIPHNCDLGKRLKRAGENGADTLVFNISAFGSQLPADVPFAVTSTDICPACGGGPYTTWFAWSEPKVYIL